MDTKTGVFDTKLHAALKGGGQAADFEDVSTAAAAAARAETELAGDYSAAAAVASKQDYADAARAAQSELSRRVALLKKLAKSSRAFSSGTGSSDTLTTDATNALRAAIGVIASIRVVNDALQAHKNAVCK